MEHTPPDSVKSTEFDRDATGATSESGDKLLDSLESRSRRSALYRFIYNNIVVKDSDADSLKDGRMLDESRNYELFRDRTIDRIILIRGNVFEGDTISWLTRAANNLHVITRENVIQRDLLIRSGDSFDAEMVIKNEQLLASRGYIAEANTYVAVSEEDSTKVDIYIATRDKWSISGDAAIAGGGRTMLKIYDANLMGFGTRLSVESHFNWKEKSYGGTRAEYLHPNIMGSFFSGRILAGTDYDDSDLLLSIEKKFLRPTDFGAGLTVAGEGRLYYMLYADSSISVKRSYVDIWGGRSVYFDGIRSSVYYAGRFNWSKYSHRPDVTPRFNPAFHNFAGVLANVGLYREKFYSTSMIYGYGYKEYLATGYKAELTGGFAWGEFSDQWYAGAHYSMGGVTKVGNFSGSVVAGTFIDTRDGEWTQSVTGVTLRYLSPLLGKGRSRVRQFGQISHIRGWNRLGGSNEVVAFDPETGLVGFKGWAAGTTRTILNSETVVFTPYKPWGFNVALFGFGSLGFLGSGAFSFDNPMFASFGLGVRFKNEQLIFNALQIRLCVIVGKSGLQKSDYISISSQPRVDGMRFTPAEPGIVEYK